MTIYLIIGIIVLMLIIQDMDQFFQGLHQSQKDVGEQFPHLSPTTIRIVMALTCVFMLLVWPIFAMYLIAATMR